MVKVSLKDKVKSEQIQSAHSSSLMVKVEDDKANIDVDALRKFKLFIATPCYGGLVTDQYFLSVFRLSQELTRLGIPFSITTLRNESLITRGRNILSAMFLESQFTHLMFIDADIEFQPDSIIRMMGMDKDLIVGAYPKKTLPVDYAINLKLYGPNRDKLNIQDGAVELLDASTGFFMIKRRVFEKLMLTYPELHYKNDSHIDPKFNKWCYAFFDTHIDEVDRRYLSEDYRFCRLWQNAGGQIWLDPNTKLNHIGSYTFEGDVSKIFKQVEQYNQGQS